MMQHATKVFSAQTKFVSSAWGIPTYDVSHDQIEALLSTGSTVRAQQELFQKMPIGLQMCFPSPLPIQETSQVLTPWTLAEFQQACKKQGKYTAPGPSGATTQHWQNLPIEGQHAVVEFLNHIQQTGVWPTAWKHGHIYPIPKGDKAVAWENMRPITLLETLMKLVTRRILERLQPILAKHEVLHNSQQGFIPGGDIFEPLRTVLHTYELTKLQNIPAFFQYLDFKNAYCSVPHWGLALSLACLQLPQALKTPFDGR